jgi:folate-binding protein YgfZ
VASADLEELLEQHRILSAGCGLVDRSERGKLALVGVDAVGFLNGQVTNDLAGLRPGEGLYAAFLTHKGKMLGDLRILALGGPEAPDRSGDVAMLLLDTERVALQALFDMIRHFKVGYRVELRKRTLESGLYSLIGPSARAVASQAAAVLPTELPPEVEHAHASALIGERAVRLIATENGELDVLFEAADGEAVLAALLATGATAVSQEAAEVVRVERSRPRYGIDMDAETIPEEAGLNERAVSFTKGCYLGQETVARLHYRGRPTRHLRGLRLSEPARAGEQLLLGERTVGRLGSTVLSPHLGPIGLALVRREAEPGARVRVGTDDIDAEVLELPFPPA